MKKSFIALLLPMAAVMLSGCDRISSGGDGAKPAATSSSSAQSSNSSSANNSGSVPNGSANNSSSSANSSNSSSQSSSQSSSSSSNSSSSGSSSSGSGSSSGSSGSSASGSGSSGSGSSGSGGSSISSDPVVLSFAARVADYEAKGYAGVEIPDYVCADGNATLTQPAPSQYPDYWLVSNTTTEEMETFVASFSSDWIDYPSSGSHSLYLGEPGPGESCPVIGVVDYTNDTLAGVLIAFMEYTEPVPAAAFPLEEVNAYLGTYAQYYGFTISQDEADAISALSTSFVAQSGTDNNGYPICQVEIGGEVASQVEAILLDTITAAGFEYDSEYGAYYNSSNWVVAFIQDGGNTYLIFN